MLDISWGELLVLGIAGGTLIGRRDLPKGFHLVGTQIGRMVGLLQGARARVDQFATNHELRALQNELRSGLRELDQVKSELAVATSSQGMVGRSLGATTLSANRRPAPIAPSTTMTTSVSSPSDVVSLPHETLHSSNRDPQPSSTIESAATLSSSLPPVRDISLSNNVDVDESERAVIEMEWEQQGIGFRSRAEQSSAGGGKNATEVLSSIIQQNLLFDQYDKVVGQQEADMQERILAAKVARQQEQKQHSPNKSKKRNNRSNKKEK